MAKYILGLDMGITSVGWGLIDYDSGKIVDKGVRLFKEATAEDNLNRRTHRGSRRLKRRRQQRIIELKRLLKKENILTDDYTPLNNVYYLRCKGLNEKLTNAELVSVLLHIAKIRGSSLEVVEYDEKKANEDKSSKANLSANEVKLRTSKEEICEKQYKDLIENGKVRGINNIYKSSSYESELKKILANQGLSKEVNDKIINIIFRRRDFNEGPGSMESPTIYGRFIPHENGEVEVIHSMIEKMQGKCSIYQNEPRAAKMSFTADLFNFLNDLNNLEIQRADNYDNYITPDEKKLIINEYIIKKGKITIQKLCDVLQVKKENITGFRVNKGEPILTEFKGYQKVLKALNRIIDTEIVDAVIDVLTKYKDVEKRKEEIKKINNAEFSEEDIVKLSEITGIQQYHSLSYKAMKVIIPELYENPENQMEVITRLNLVKTSIDDLKGRTTIPSYSDRIYSPVAKRVHNETIKVVNAVIKKYGDLDSIVIEMARDRNTVEERKNIEQAQKRNQENREKAKEILDVNYSFSKLDSKLVQKIMLYNQQDGKSMYSGKPINLNVLISDPNAYEIDHIIPLSISLDDSIANKVLVYRSENQQKLNNTPLQYLRSGNSNGWSADEFREVVIKMYNDKKISLKKLQNLLCEKDITKQDVRKEFIERNLVDTRYASRVVLGLLKDYFKANNKNTKVFTIRGQITSQFRKSRNLVKSRDCFYHHIVDALIIAYFRKFNYINELMQYNFNYKGKIDEETGELIQYNDTLFSTKDDDFTIQLRKLNDFNKYSEDIKISHKIDRKPNRQFSDETIYSARKIDNDYMKISKYKDIYGEEGKKFAKVIKDNLQKEKDLDKFLMKKVDPETFNLLVSIVINTTCGEKENPFVKYCEENNIDFIRKKSKNGNGPIIRSIRYYDGKVNSHLDISQKYVNLSDDKKVVLLNISPYRTDFYLTKEGNYKFLTIKYANIKENHNGYYIPKEVYESLKKSKKINDSDEFLFSLYRNDYLRITTNDPAENVPMIYRFVGTNNDLKNVVEVKPIYCDKNEENRIMKTIGKKVTKIEKFDVDVLGNKIAKKRDKCLQLEL